MKDELDKIVNNMSEKDMGDFNSITDWVYENVDINKLSSHHANKEYFSESIKYSSDSQRRIVNELFENIKSRGIRNPLIVTHDYKILSGNRRYLILCKLLEDTGDAKYAIVPCMRIKKKLTEAQERMAIIEANLFYRNLDVFRNEQSGYKRKMLQKERIKLYEMIFPGFMDRVLEPGQNKLGITAAKINEKLGISKDTAKKDLANIRLKKTIETNNKKLEANKINVESLDLAKVSCRKIKTILSRSNDETQKEIKKFVKKTLEISK